MQSAEQSKTPTQEAEEICCSQPLPPAVSRVFSQALDTVLAPLRERVDALTQSIPGVFGDAVPVNRGPKGTQGGGKKSAKRHAGHLEEFDRLRDSFRKSARTLKHVPCREGFYPGEDGDEVAPDSDHEDGFPVEGEGVTEDDASSEEDDEYTGRPWRPASQSLGSVEEDDKTSDMFDPTKIYHPRSSEWIPDPKVASYVAGKVRQPLEREVRTRMRSECPRPKLEGRVAATPDIDDKLYAFFAKFMKDPRKGIDRSWRNCQDKLLDVVGPVTQIIQLAERAKESGTPMSTEVVAGWAQRALCFLGNANCALAAEHRRSLLIKIDPKLGDLATAEAGPIAQGKLFGEPFIKELNKFVTTFSALDRAQTSIKKIFPGRVFAGAGRGRGRSSGRQFQQGPNNKSQQRRNNGWNDGRQGNFYLSRGAGKGRGRGYHGGANAPGGPFGECYPFFPIRSRGEGYGIISTTGAKSPQTLGYFRRSGASR
ncbi:uncharacterized protein LOC144823513 [Lissotriton helveticus]